PAATRHCRAKGECVARTLVLLDRGIEAPGCDAPVMEAVAALLDHLAVHGGRIVVGLDELDVHVAGEAHGERYVRARRLPAVDGIDTGEVLEHEPGADGKLHRPLPHRLLQVRDDIGHLHDAVIRLTEPYLTHDAPRSERLFARRVRTQPCEASCRSRSAS